MIIELNEKNFDEVVKAHDLVIVDFYANWCGPCRMLGQELAEIEKESNVVIGKVNCDDNEELCVKYGISSIPHLFIFKDGKIASDIIGYLPKEVLASKIFNA